MKKFKQKLSNRLGLRGKKDEESGDMEMTIRDTNKVESNHEITFASSTIFTKRPLPRNLSPLLALPREIRDEIYLSTFDLRVPVIYIDKVKSLDFRMFAAKWDHSLPQGLVLTCWQIKSEVLETYYKEKMFAFYTMKPGRKMRNVDVFAYYTKIPPVMSQCLMANITKLEVGITVDVRSIRRTPMNNYRALALILNIPKLRLLRLIFRVYRGQIPQSQDTVPAAAGVFVYWLPFPDAWYSKRVNIERKGYMYTCELRLAGKEDKDCWNDPVYRSALLADFLNWDTDSGPRYTRPIRPLKFNNSTSRQPFDILAQDMRCLRLYNGGQIMRNPWKLRTAEYRLGRKLIRHLTTRGKWA